MKSFCYIICLSANLSLGMVACTSSRSGGPSALGPTGSSGTSRGGRAQGGGVDVGNMQSVSIPRTSMVVSQPANWNATSTETSLTLASAGSDAQIEFGPSDLALTSPNALGIKAALDARDRGRDHRIVRFNGLEGVRTDSVPGADGRLRSELYIVSEMSDFVRVRLSAGNARAKADAERVLGTTRLLYRGAALNQSEHTVDFDPAWPALYSFSRNCLRPTDPNCGTGVTASFHSQRSRDGSDELWMRLGNAGGESGRIVDLGPEAEVPFAEVRIDGQFLLSRASRTPLADVYVEFTPREQNIERREIVIQTGRVYLLRTISWPDEDMLVKVRFDHVAPNRVRMVYQNLAAVPRETLQRQIDAINAYTRAVETPRERGEVTLYNRGYFDSYPYASFNFQHATSGNLFITFNSWDVLLSGERTTGANPRLSTPHSGNSIGSVVDLGAERTLDSVSQSDVPDFNHYNRDRDWQGSTPIEGHTYLVWHLNYGSGTLTVGALRVLQQAASFTRLEWRRVSIGPAPHFQRWIPLPGNDGVREFSLGPNGHCFLVSETCGEQGIYEESHLYSGGRSTLSIDTRPFTGTNGFLVLPSGTSFESVTADSLSAIREPGQPHIRDPQPGAVILVRHESFFFNSLAVMEIVSVDSTGIHGRIRTLTRARTPFASVAP